MSNRNLILSLTRIAFLDGLIISLLCIQFVFQPFFVLMLAIIPAIIAMTFYQSPSSAALSSLVVLSLLTFAMFGAVNGIWMLVYVSEGIVLGLTSRGRMKFPFRLMLMMLTFIIGIVVTTVLFALMAGINPQDAMKGAASLPSLIRSALFPIIMLSFFVWSIFNALGADAVLSRTLRQIDLVGR